MLSWKDKAKQKFSRLFSRSRTFRSPSHDGPQARLYSKKGRLLSSADSSIHSSLSFNGHTSHGGSPDNKSIHSPPVKCKNSSLASLDNALYESEKCDHNSERKVTPDNFQDNKDHGMGRNTKLDTGRAFNSREDGNPGSAVRSIGCESSDMLANGRDLPDVKKSMPYLMGDSSFISVDLYEFLLSSLPNIIKGCQWALLYSTVKHGISLRTLIRRSSDLPGPCLLIVGDKQGAVFGGLLEGPLKPTPKRKYQGTNQTFVFTTVYGEPRLFRPTGTNRYFYMCLSDLLAFGGGGNFALCMDEDLLSGTSGPCETFGNLCLAHNPEFELKNVELWGFTHSSRYLT